MFGDRWPTNREQTVPMSFPPDVYVLDLLETDWTQIGLVGGKAAQLGELTRIEGVRVPAGFCATTAAFRHLLGDSATIADRLDRLSSVNVDDRDTIARLSAEIRRVLQGTAIPAEVAAAITGALARLDDRTAYAVRSSATAEDRPAASFAGQQDTYLNIVGAAAILQQVRRCWASLFTERAVTYRLRNGFDHREVEMAVVVQQLVFADAAGVLFTADPLSGHRKVAVVEATLGLGEALVAGRTNPDVYRVRDGRVVARAVGNKPSALRARPGGGTYEQWLDPARQDQPALTDSQVLQLAQLGRLIEARLGCPQDIEWCLDDDGFQIVQSRPITTLFPVPEVGDQGNHVYLSVGHQQMMTDAMKPLGLSLWQRTALAPMYDAGGRLFVDPTRRLASPASRAGLLEVIGQGDPLTRDALQTLLDRGDFIPSLPDPVQPAAGGASTPIVTDPALVTSLVEESQASIAVLRRDIEALSGPALFDFLLEAFAEHKRALGDPLSMRAIMAGMEATWWLNDHLKDWLGEKNAADSLTLSAPGNITSEMGLALLDVADVVRPHPEVVAFLQEVDDDGFLDRLPALAGGSDARQAIEAYLTAYGMRCVGEIDITRPRWSERPSTLVPLLLDNIRNFTPGARRRRFEQGREQAEQKARDVLERLRALPDGARKAEAAQGMIERVRTFIGYREYPKYAIISRYAIYKKALLDEADRLVQAQVLAEPEDIFFLTFAELHDVARSHEVDAELVRRRKDAFSTFQALTPPRVLTSDGEVPAGAYRREDVPAGALVGLAISAGIVEGRARVLLDLAEADLDTGDILVTAYTDPSWSPVFPTITGLVTGVGGLMSHGAVVAREYGLPAVVGVENVTRLIRDGQRIRVNGAEGYVEILDDLEERPAAVR